MMPKGAARRVTTGDRVYLIVGLFVSIIVGLVLYFQFQMNVAVAIRVFVGGEGLWAKAQKDALVSLHRYADSRDEAEYEAFLELIEKPQWFRRARLALQRPEPDLAAAREALVQSGLHPVDIDYAIPFFLRFGETPYLSRAVEHWARGDRLIEELIATAAELRAEVAGGRGRSEAISAIEARLADVNRRLRIEEDQFSATLAEASRWASDMSRILTYVVALGVTVLGILLSWSIIRRIRLTESALVESEERYRTIFERVNDVIYTVSPDGRFTSLSPAGERMTGWPAATWIGQPFTAIVHPDDLPRAEEAFRKTLAGQCMNGVEVRISRKSGGFVDSDHSIVPLTAGGTVTAVLGIGRDISERKRMEAELRASEQRLRAVLEATGDGILVADAETGRFVVGNRAICDMLGYGPEELYGLGVQDIHPPEALPEVQRQFESQSKGELRVAENLPVKGKDGRTFFADVSGAPAMLGGRAHVVGVFHDVTRRKRAEEEISQLAWMDSLTGISNRRAFIAVLEREIERARHYGPEFSIIMYDLDHFKRINDGHGHAVGDEVLRTVADLVKRSIRSADAVARWGGEEFLVLLGESDLQAACGVAEKLRQTIAGHRFERLGEVTASFGVTAYEAGDDIGSLLKRADDALYLAKSNGRNRVESARARG